MSYGGTRSNQFEDVVKASDMIWSEVEETIVRANKSK